MFPLPKPIGTPSTDETGFARMEVRGWLGESESVSIVENIQRSLALAWDEVRVNEAMRENCSLCMDLRRDSVSSKESA